MLYGVTAPKLVTAKKLQKLQNRAALIITRTNYSIRSSAVLNSLEWSNLEEREKRHLFITMLKVSNNNCPTYFQEHCHRTSEVHNYNLRGSNYDLQLQLPKTNFLKRSFSYYRGVMAWNQLSNQIREIRDLAISSLLDTFYIATAHFYMACFVLLYSKL